MLSGTSLTWCVGGAGFLLPGATPQGKAALGAKGGETRLGQFQSPTYRSTTPSLVFPQYPEPQRGATGWCPGEEDEWTLTGSGPDQPLCSSLPSPGMSPLGSQSATLSLGFCGCQMWKTTVVERNTDEWTRGEAGGQCSARRTFPAGRAGFGVNREQGPACRAEPRGVRAP